MAAKKRKPKEPLGSPTTPDSFTAQTGDVSVSASSSALPIELAAPGSDSPSIPDAFPLRSTTNSDAHSNQIEYVAIPIKPYPGYDEPYLQSFELLRSNAYEAAFSLGRLANALRFSQFLHHYRQFGRNIVVPKDFWKSVQDCLRLLDSDTVSEASQLLINCMKYHADHMNDDEPFDYESFWSPDVNYQYRENVRFFRHPLSERYAFLLNTRSEPWETLQHQDFSGWLDYLESLYDGIQTNDRRLAHWMLAGWNLDRLVRPEMEIALLEIEYRDPQAIPTFGKLPVPSAAVPAFDCMKMQCTACGYNTRDPEFRNICSRQICFNLGSKSVLYELPQPLDEFEKAVANWVCLCAEEQLLSDQISAQHDLLMVLKTQNPQPNDSNSGTESTKELNVDEVSATRAKAVESTKARVLTCYTKYAIDDRIDKIVAIVQDPDKSVQEKLVEIDKIMKLPKHRADLARMLEVSPPAVGKTKWWDDHGKGQYDETIAEREDRYRAGIRKPGVDRSEKTE